MRGLYSNAQVPFDFIKMKFCERFHMMPWDFDTKMDMAELHRWLEYAEIGAAYEVWRAKNPPPDTGMPADDMMGDE